MIFKHLSKLVPNLKLEDLVQTKFHKPSLIDSAEKDFRNNNKEKLKNYHVVKLDLERLIKIIKK